MTSRSFLSKVFSSMQGKDNQAKPSVDAASSSTSHRNIYGFRVLKEPEAQEGELILDIVFVHGLTGNRENTWTCNNTLWPETLLPKEIPNARILTFGYDADVVNFWLPAGQNRIGNHAQNLAQSLANLRDRTETALLKSKNSAEPYLQSILAQTRGICFLGTPHCGASLAAWASLCGNFTNLVRRTNKNILNVLNPDSEVLANIQEEFHTMLRARADQGEKAIKMMCFFEELPIVGVGLIVPQHSAILPAYGSKSIHANHIDMTKFEYMEDSGFVDVSTTLWRWARDLAKETSVTGDFQPVGAQYPSELPHSPPRPLTIEDGRSQGNNMLPNVNEFSGQNNTGGGRVFQGSINSGGNVSVG